MKIYVEFFFSAVNTTNTRDIHIYEFFKFNRCNSILVRFSFFRRERSGALYTIHTARTIYYYNNMYTASPIAIYYNVGTIYARNHIANNFKGFQHSTNSSEIRKFSFDDRSFFSFAADLRMEIIVLVILISEKKNNDSSYCQPLHIESKVITIMVLNIIIWFPRNLRT